MFAHFAAFSHGKSKDCLGWTRSFRAFCSFLERKKQGLPRQDTIFSRILQLFRAEKARIALNGHNIFAHFLDDFRILTTCVLITRSKMVDYEKRDQIERINETFKNG